MLDKKKYANGQIVHELKGNKRTYFYKNGIIKAVDLHSSSFAMRMGEYRASNAKALDKFKTFLIFILV